MAALAGERDAAIPLLKEAIHVSFSLYFLLEEKI
jgi:hypothetical protein